MFWTLYMIGCLSPRCLVLFLKFSYVVSFGPYFLCLGAPLKGWSQVFSRVGQHTLLRCGTTCAGGAKEETMPLAWLLPHFPLLLSLPTRRLFPFRGWFPGEWVCVCSRIPWISPTDSPVRLGVSPTATIPTGSYSQGFWGFISLHWNPALRSLSCSPVVPPCLSTYKCKSRPPASASPTPVWHYIATCSFCPSCLSPPLLPVWMNDSCLTPWLSDFHEVWFSDSSGCFLFLNWLLSFFWVCKDVKCFYPCLHLGQDSNCALLICAHYELPLSKAFLISPFSLFLL